MDKTFDSKKLSEQVKAKSLPSNIFLGASILFGLAPSIIIVVMVGFLMNGSFDMRHFGISAAGITASLLLKALFYALSIWKAHDAAYGTLTDIRLNMIEHMRRMPISFFQKRKTGDLANIINHDVEQAEVYLAHAIPEIMSSTIIPAAIFVVVLIMDWRMGLAMVSTLPLVYLLRKGVNSMWFRRARKFSASKQKMSEDLVEYIANISVIKAFAKEEQKTKNVLNGIKEYLRWVKKSTIGVSIPMSIITMLMESGVILIIMVGSTLFLEGQISVQQLILAFILGGVFSASFSKMATFQHYGIVFNQSMRNVGSVLGEEAPRRSNLLSEADAGDIVFKDVSFSYDKDNEVLSYINLTFKENSLNAIVGSSGSGKSTLANLIMGFWEPDSGMVSIGGKNIADMTEQTLAGLVSMVQQDVFLFNLSIEENIRIGKPDATLEEIMEAAKRAQIHDFIVSLPKGYDTMAGEAGVKFSGGEKQRISIARMILKNAPIIILDEATAAIDPNNEHLIQKAISNLGKDKTIITIAHHLNTIVGANQIIVMDAGKAVAAGTHEELLATCPLYAEMVEQQNKVDTWQIKEELV
ncbi:ABC transporter ATP-binding protein [Sinanaerobacter sp. ZZT-01]|uniref:ABC transporter ATP-binding protein n=1 Tax=Sinanaerobacter sp. ZZT-01 TaxID=3111540 RepID=UPI002D792FEE|nr:ABC transporter ATP-binding protein [Sinanaerobacter sp. ZZT-01]WRR94327.1 ABC transporter ATP-binding protein [Sinanaerobacter sp. ZZT-01]